MKKILLFLLTFVLLAGCNQPPKTNEADEKETYSIEETGECDSVRQDTHDTCESFLHKIHELRAAYPHLIRKKVEKVTDSLTVHFKVWGIFETDTVPISYVNYTINKMNHNIEYGYNNWRLPTEEELSLLREKKYLHPQVSYMSSEQSVGSVIFVNDGQDYLSLLKKNEEDSWADLGLPSGVKWKKWNEEDEYSFYNFKQAYWKFGTREYGTRSRIDVPSYYEFLELIENCDWHWSGSGYKVTGSNGNFIYLPARGIMYNSNSGKVEWYSDGEEGYYWSCDGGDCEMSGTALFFDSDSVKTITNGMYSYMTIRLVKRE